MSNSASGAHMAGTDKVLVPVDVVLTVAQILEPLHPDQAAELLDYVPRGYLAHHLEQA